MKFPRKSGILLHLTSLPGPSGIGDLGKEAYRFVDFLIEAGQSLWQILPLNPIGCGNSSYASPSAFAGNPLLISLEKLAEDGFLSPKDLPARKWFPSSRVDFQKVGRLKAEGLSKACETFWSGGGGGKKKDFEIFCREHAYWLDNYALYNSIKQRFKGAAWFDWPHEIAFRKPLVLKEWQRQLKKPVEEAKFVQYLFFRQWQELRQYANRRGIRIIGDIPIFVNYDSADVWSCRGFYYLDEKGRRTALSGVPPVGNFEVSQIWGNPLYRWKKMAKDGFRWWMQRFANILELVDIVRIDHFTGFCKTWHIPPGAKTSAEGCWVEGPGALFFRKIEEKLGELPVIAEDLGPIQNEVDILLAETGFPCTRVIQFAFDGGPDNPHLPENYPPNCAAYTGTHDNDTALGWFRSLPANKKERVLKYLGADGGKINWKLIAAVLESPADFAIIPLQDILGLGSKARMNTPGQEEGQWEWRFQKGMIISQIAQKMAALTLSSAR